MYGSHSNLLPSCTHEQMTRAFAAAYTYVRILGFALAKGLIRGLTRYPNPSSSNYSGYHQIGYGTRVSKTKSTQIFRIGRYYIIRHRSPSILAPLPMGLGNSLSDQRYFCYPHSLAAGRSIHDIDATRILISSQRQHPFTEAMGEERLRALD